MTKVTYEKILQFRRAQEQYSQMHPAQFRPFLYALTKMATKLKVHEDEFTDADRVLNLEYCAKDSKGFAEMEKYTVERRGEKKEEERFKFTLEKQKELNVAKRKLLNTEVEIDPHITTDIPDDMDFQWWNVFAPFILPEEPSEEELKKLYAMTEKKLEDQKAKK